ncbi:MAG: membrane dipeptidase [Bacteroidia bacterium]|nr:membrane dipeptidase [Bacteroidia bacterium]
MKKTAFLLLFLNLIVLSVSAQTVQNGFHMAGLEEKLFWDFESGFERWTQTGTAFQNQPTWGDNVRMDRVTQISLGGDYWKDLAYPIGHSRNYWIGTNENRPGPESPLGGVQGNEPTGSLLSPAFVLASDYITFLIGGGESRDSLRLELLVKEPRWGQVILDDERYRSVRYATGSNNDLLQRGEWEVREFFGRECRIRITDEARGAWGHINVDDIRFQTCSIFCPLDTAMPSVEVIDKMVLDKKAPVWGWVDLHSHPMSFMGFGSKGLHGSFDGPPEQAFTDCSGAHRAWSPWNPNGNIIRAAAVSQIEDYCEKTPHGKGYHANPNKCFAHYPAFWSTLHAQLWVEWLERAHQGGLSVLVALAVNNELLADALQGDPPFDDMTVANLQTDSLKAIVERHDFMEIAYTPEQLRSIVRQGKLAIILGIETDNIGNYKAGQEVTEGQMISEIHRLYNQGIRYIFPIHLVNNPVGGAAVYEDLFNMANKYATGEPYVVEPAPAESNIAYNLTGGNSGFLGLISLGNADFPKDVLPVKDHYPTYESSPTGHRNVQGLTPLGKIAIREMMRLGMIIDIDHMSEKSANETLEMALQMGEGYPINSGHNGFRKDGIKGTENSRTMEQVEKMVKLGGMMGVGLALGKGGVGPSLDVLLDGQPQKITNSKIENNCSGSGRTFVQNYLFAQEIFGGKNVATGTDANGMVAFPGPRYGENACYQIRKNKEIHAQHVAAQDSASRVTYWGGASGKNAPLAPCETAGHKWDINTDGVAHYGLFPDFFQDLRNSGMSKEDMSRFMHTGEDFAQMWQRCIRVSEWVK